MLALFKVAFDGNGEIFLSSLFAVTHFDAGSPTAPAALAAGPAAPDPGTLPTTTTTTCTARMEGGRRGKLNWNFK